MLLGMRQPAQHREPLPDRVRAGRQPFVRQGFPARERHDGVRAEQVGQDRCQFLGDAAGRRDHEHRPVGAADLGRCRECGGDQWPGGDRTFEFEQTRAGVLDHGTESGVGQHGTQQAGQWSNSGHEETPLALRHGQTPARDEPPVGVLVLHPTGRG
jgi:hypothetical protein